MNKISKLIEWIRQLPEWGKTVGSIATTILILVSLYGVYVSNFPGFILIVFPIFVLIIFATSLYLLFARNAPQIIGGKGTLISGTLTRIVTTIVLVATITSSTSYYMSKKGREEIGIALHGTSTPTPTNTPSSTPISTSTYTQIPSPTPTPKEHGIYYMIVLDASLRMLETFETESKWDAALRAVNAILEGREREANYGLVVIGGSQSQGGANPCDQPSTVAVPFSSRDSVVNHINQLQPSGGGSIFTAFNLAKDQFRALPENTVHTLVFITGSSDACESRDEWMDLQRSFNFPGGIGIELYSKIIVLEKNAVISRTIEEQFDNLSANLNVQAPQTIFQLVQTNNTVINNVSNYVNITVSSFLTSTPPMSTSTNPVTPKPGPIITLPPGPEAITITPSYTPSFIPSWTPSLTPSFTPIPPPLVELLSYNYLQSGIGCQVDITVRVTGSSATGSFHVWNANYPPEGDIYSPTTLPVGAYNNNLVTLGGLSPEYYRHEVWFEYNGILSNRLTNLICPNLTPSP